MICCWYTLLQADGRFPRRGVKLLRETATSSAMEKEGKKAVARAKRVARRTDSVEDMAIRASL